MTDMKRRGTPAREEAVIHELDERIEKMEAELADGQGKPLSWDEVTSTTADELAAKEQRRSILPRLITAARVKRLELIRAKEERNLPALAETLERTYGLFQEAEEILCDAQNERIATMQNWNDALRTKQRLDERIKRIDAEIAEVRGGS